MTDPTDAIPDAELLDLLGPSWAAMSPRQRWEYGVLNPTDEGWKKHLAYHRKAQKKAGNAAKQIASAKATADRYDP